MSDGSARGGIVADGTRLRRRRGGLLAALAAMFVEPATDHAGGAAAFAEPAGPGRPVVAVAGFARRCGTTTVARALATELAACDASGAAVVTATETAGAGFPLGTPAAGRLARAVQRALPTRTRIVGRLCLTLAPNGHEADLVAALRGMAPLVLDVEEPAAAAVAASLADAVVLVATPVIEPALSPVVAASLANVGPEPIVVLNRARAEEREAWEPHAELILPEARAGARLAQAGREPRGYLGHAVADLAARLGREGR